ncbi:hypothetical protein [Agarivorans gilvus]|uniref:HEPN AbiU2-like domain-containing protein n=1 Tax=Agarivorans gilvus TaxID=680279 RepID=A0ABQ1I4V9_9ALTE|nr:hypothetical protein [Agarivorans gilvus]GGB12486.1 hypothetical protein GCM10007414_27330 [Agarivorans gilvus]
MKLLELEEILTNVMMDLATAVNVLRDYESRAWFQDPKNSKKRQCLWRLCISAIVINCSKYMEVNEKYGKYFKEELHEYTELRNKFYNAVKSNTSIKKLRNYTVAHVSNKSDYLSADEVQQEILLMFGNSNASDFLDWLCPEDIESTNKNDSLVGVLEQLRDAVSKKL